jgi:hypothetical protein
LDVKLKYYFGFSIYETKNEAGNWQIFAYFTHTLATEANLPYKGDNVFQSELYNMACEPLKPTV